MSNPTPSPGPASRATWHIELRKILENYFDETELETLCFDLRVDYESLAGDTKAHKVVDLVRTFARTGRIDELIDYCSRVRPNVPWGELRQAAASNPLVVDARPDEPAAPPRTPPPPTPGPVTTPAPQPKRPGWLFGLIAVLVVALGIAVWRLVFPPPGPIPTATPPTTTTSATSRTTTPARLRILELTLRAHPSEHVGPCPVKITFSGHVSVAGGSGTVSYKFLRSDGAIAPVRTLTFDGPGTQEIEDTWTLGSASRREYTGWQAVQIIEPGDWTTDKATFRITCTS